MRHASLWYPVLVLMVEAGGVLLPPSKPRSVSPWKTYGRLSIIFWIDTVWASTPSLQNVSHSSLVPNALMVEVGGVLLPPSKPRSVSPWKTYGRLSIIFWIDTVWASTPSLQNVWHSSLVPNALMVEVGPCFHHQNLVVSLHGKQMEGCLQSSGLVDCLTFEFHVLSYQHLSQRTKQVWKINVSDAR